MTSLTELLQCIIPVLILSALKGSNACDKNYAKPDMGTYKAAVYEHAVILPEDTIFPVPRKVALENMMKNLDIYRQQAEAAAKEVCTLTFNNYLLKIKMLFALQYRNQVGANILRECRNVRSHPSPRAK